MSTFEYSTLSSVGTPYWWYNEESKQMLSGGYLQQGESVEDAIERICLSASKRLYKPEFKNIFKEMIIKGWISFSSPVWANMGTSRGLPISCFNVYIPDDIVGISDKLSEVIVQTKTGGGTSGYYGDVRARGSKISGNGTATGSVSFMNIVDTVIGNVSQGSCYEKGTEILTNKGFKDFRDIDPKHDKIAQVDEYGNIDFTDTYELTSKKYTGDLVKIRGKKRDDLISIGVTTNHRMVVERMKGRKSSGTKRWAGYTEIVKAEDLRLHRDNRLYISGKTSTISNRLTDEERLKIAFQADGRKDKRGCIMRFRFTKQRKIDRLLDIVNRLKLKYKTQIESKTGVTNIYVYDVKKLKKPTFSWVEFDKISYDWCQDFLEEVSEWDGNKFEHSFSYCSTVKENVDIVQAVAILSNKRARIRIEADRPGNRQDLYTILISDNNKVLGSSCETYREAYDDMVYCCIVPKGKIIVRYDNRTLICGNTRRGAFCSYLPIDHGDIEEFLQIRNIGNPIQNLFTGVCVSDSWMQDMIDGNEKNREIWAKVLKSRKETGMPFIVFSDTVNNNKPEVYKKHSLTINGSNLCSEIMLPSTEDESFVCCLASMNLELYDEWKDTDAVYYATFFLDAVMEEFIRNSKGKKHLENARRFAKRHRALGLGVLGYHSYLQKNNIPFESMMAKMFNAEAFRRIQAESQRASRDLAEIYGEPELLKGTGLRNTTTMAIAPTTSSSSILGQTSQGIEPFASNYYKVGLAKGNFMRKNKYLKKLLEEKGKDTEEVWRDIMLSDGSVQHLDFLSDDEKAVFKTFKEIAPIEIIVQAGQRQKYIDQSQSLNLNIPPNVPVKDVNAILIEAWKVGVKTLYYQRSSSISKLVSQQFTATCSSCEA